MVISHNLPAINAHRMLRKNTRSLNKTLNKLSTGLRISKAADDAAGLAISEKMRAQIKGLNKAARNAQDSISMIQTADGAINEMNSALDRMRELSVQGSNDTLTDSDRQAVNREFEQLKGNLDRISQETEYNGINLLNGSSGATVTASNSKVKVCSKGSLEDIEGDYKINTSVEAGKGQVQQSSIMKLKNGTMSEDVQYSPSSNKETGIKGFSSKNLLPEDYRVQTREEVYGGIQYNGTSGITNVDTTGTPDVVANGSYDIVTADEVPFMATYADSQTGTDIVKGVEPTGRNDIDVKMDITENGAPVNAQSEIAWKDIGGAGGGDIRNAATGGDVAVQTKTNYDNNVYTHFDVQGIDARDLLAGSVTAKTYYKSANNASVDLNLTYKTQAASEAEVNATYYSASGEQVTAETSYVTDVGTTVTIGGTTSTIGSMDIEQAVGQLNSDFTDISFSRQDNWNGTSYISVTNNTGSPITIENNTGTNLGIAVVGLANGASVNGDSFDYENAHTYNVGNRDIDSIASTLSNDFNTDGYPNMDVDIADNSDGTKHLQFNNNTSNYRVVFKTDAAANSVEQELGFAESGDLTLNIGDTHDGTDVFDNHSFDFAIGDLDMDDLASELETQITGETVGSVSIDPSEFDVTTQISGDQKRLIVNSSKYRITLNDHVGNSLDELNMEQTITRGETDYSNYAYDNATTTVNVLEGRIGDIENELNTALWGELNADGLTGSVFNKFNDQFVGDEARIDITGTDIRYELEITDNTSTTASDLGLDGTYSRTDTQTGTLRDYGKTLGTISSGQNIEEIRSDIEGLAGYVSASWVNAAFTPGYDGSHHYGRFNVNVTDAGPERREVEFSGAGKNQLFGWTSAVADNDDTLTSETWQARDRVNVRTEWTGVSNNGGAVNGTSYDWWWEGDDGTTNPLISSHPEIPFSSIYIPDNDDVATEITGSWCMYTSASSAGASDQLDFELVDEQTATSYSWGGAWGGGALPHKGGGRYILNDGVLDDSNFTAPQLIRTGAGSYTSVNQDVDFGTVSAQNNALVYKERYSDPSYNHEAHVSYGDDTTYYFANMGESGAPTDYIQACEVWPQETDNCSLLFQVKSTEPPVVQVEGKGYNRDGSDSSFGPVEVTLNPAGGPVEIGTIQFDDLRLGGDLSINDKFVVNVAARAGITNAEISHGDTDYTDSNIAVEGNPFELRGSTMEYRFDQGVEDGKNLNLLGYFVHPLTGGTETGIMTGSIEMKVSGSGFTSGTQVTGNQGASVDINYYGRSDKKAGALITHYYFSGLNEFQQPSEVIDEIKYDTGGDYNSSILFDVAEVNGDKAVFHVQAHTYDTQGNYRYFEEDYLELGYTNDGLTLFTDEDFSGLKFDTFSFEDISKMTVGDRFVVNTGADTSEKAGSDEITSFTDSFYGSMYPGSWRFEDSVVDNTETRLKFYQIEPQNCPSTNAGDCEIDDGRVFDGEMTFDIGDFNGGTVDGVEGSNDTPLEVKDAVEFSSVWKEGETLGVAHKYNYLEDVMNFYDSKKGFMLDENRTLKINYKDKERTINLTPNQTIRGLLDDINRIVYEDFEQSDYVKEDEKYKFANYVNHPDETGETENVKGSFVLRTAVTGEEGEIRLSGNKELLDVLEMIETQESEENTCNLNIKNATTGKSVIQEKLASGSDISIMDSNLMIGIDSEFGLQNTTFDELDEEFVWENSNDNEFSIHVKDNSLEFQIGANENQDTRLGIGDMTTEALDLDTVSVETREDAEKAIGKVDDAKARVVTQQAKLGAMQNRLEKAINVSENTAENITASESRIRDADMAKQTMLMAKQQMLVQSAQSMLAQANQLSNSSYEAIRSMVGA